MTRILMSDAIRIRYVLNDAERRAEELDLVLTIEDDGTWSLHNSDRNGMLDVGVEEILVEGDTPSELLQFLKGYAIGLRAPQQVPVTVKKKKAKATS